MSALTFMRSGHPVSLCTGILDPVVIVDEESLLLLKKVIYLNRNRCIFAIDYHISHKRRNLISFT